MCYNILGGQTLCYALLLFSTFIRDYVIVATFLTKTKCFTGCLSILASLCEYQFTTYICLSLVYIYLKSCTYIVVSACLDIGGLLCCTPYVHDRG